MSKPIVFLFAGQGSQYFHMGRELFERQPDFRAHMEDLDAVARAATGVSVVAALYDSQRARSDPFAQTPLTHPAIFMVECALAQLLQDMGLRPDCVLGASLGSFAAAVAAGCIERTEAQRAVLTQARILQEVCAPGGMLAVLGDPALYLDDPAAYAGCELAGINFPRHFVIAGAPAALAVAESDLRARQVAVQRLAVSHAFHSRGIDAAQPDCCTALGVLSLRPPRIPLLSCMDGSLAPAAPDYFWHSIRRPIRFAQAIARIEADGGARYVDVSPSGTAATFVKYNLPPGSASEIFAVMTPFGDELRNLERLLAAV
jgi:acyl transferase domain-containing protein